MSAKSSLTRKNGVEITTGAGASPTFSTIKKYKRFKMIQLLNRKISKLKKLGFLEINNPTMFSKNQLKIISLSEKLKNSIITICPKTHHNKMKKVFLLNN